MNAFATTLRRAAMLTLACLALTGCDVVAPTPIASEQPEALARRAGTTVFRGLPLFPEGAAQLTFDDTDGSERVWIQGIGSSGLDGVCIDLGHVDGHSQTYAPIALDQLLVEFEIRGTRFDGSDVGVGLHFESSGGTIGLQSDLARLVVDRFELFRGGTRVHAEASLSRSELLTVTDDARVIGFAFHGRPGSAPNELQVEIQFAQPTPMRISGVGVVLGDHVRVNLASTEGPLYPAAWESRTLFEAPDGIPIDPLSLQECSISKFASEYAGTSGSLIAFPDPSSILHVAPMAGETSSGASAHLLADVNHQILNLDGTRLDDEGQSLDFDFLGTAHDFEKETGPTQLVINLSLGWESGLLVSATNPFGSAVVEARCRGALVIAVVVSGADVAPILDVADGYRGFEVAQTRFHRKRGEIVVVGSAVLEDGSRQELVIRARPIQTPTMATWTDAAIVTYDAAGARDSGWSLLSARPAGPRREEMPDLHG